MYGSASSATPCTASGGRPRSRAAVIPRRQGRRRRRRRRAAAPGCRPRSPGAVTPRAARGAFDVVGRCALNGY
ncbi:hypothetical protein HBB16_16110 [Pseudonocardia sp. MCCB 268]|nr:hypothetical protein [Pseudonocardia cytotoxica]